MTAFPVPCPMNLAALSMSQASLLVLRDLQRGLAGLGAIARLAPLLGALSSTVACLWFLDLPSNLCDYGDCAGGLSECYVPLLLSLPVAIFARALRSTLARRVAKFELEIWTAALDTLNHLARCRAPNPPHSAYGQCPSLRLY